MEHSTTTALMLRKKHLLPGFASSTWVWGPGQQVRPPVPPPSTPLARLGYHRGWIAALRGSSDV